MHTVDELQLGVIGATIYFPLKNPENDGPLDLTGVQQIRIYLKPRKGDVKERVGVVEAPATDGIASYTTVQDDIDELGKWKAQARPIYSDQEDFPSEVTVAFDVLANLY